MLARVNTDSADLPVNFYEVSEQIGDLALSVLEHYCKEIAPIYLYRPDTWDTNVYYDNVLPTSGEAIER